MPNSANVGRGAASTPAFRCCCFRCASTQFVDATEGATLLVRIYPDQISVDAHEAELTSGEVADAQAYWGVVWRAGTAPASDNSIRTAWSVLRQVSRPPRAAWIVRRRRRPISLRSRRQRHQTDRIRCRYRSFRHLRPDRRHGTGGANRPSPRCLDRGRAACRRDDRAAWRADPGRSCGDARSERRGRLPDRLDGQRRNAVDGRIRRRHVGRDGAADPA